MTSPVASAPVRRALVLADDEHALATQLPGRLADMLRTHGYAVHAATLSSTPSPAERALITARTASFRVLRAARTPSARHRPLLRALDRLGRLAPRVLARRRVELATRFDPWFRRRLPGVDLVVVLEGSTSAWARQVAARTPEVPVVPARHLARALRRDPVARALAVRAELDEQGATEADPAQVAAALLDHVTGLVRTDDPRAAGLIGLALGVLFHRELHSDSPDAPLFHDAEDFLAPVRATEVWRLLTGPGQPAAARHARSTTTVMVLPGAYGTFFAGIGQALELPPVVEIDTVARTELRGHLLTMGISEQVIAARLAAARGTSAAPAHGYPELAARLHRGDPDVLVIDWADKTAVLATLLAPARTRVVLRVHGVDLLRPWVHLLDWGRVEAVVAVSEPLAHLARSIIGDRLPADQVHVIANQVDLARFAEVADQPRDIRTLCLVGWAQRVKDPLLALEILARLREDGTDWRLLLVGQDLPDEAPASGREHTAAVRARLLQDDLRDAVEFTGFVSDLPPVLARAGVVLSTSLREGWPVGVAEAVAAGAVPLIRDWPLMAGHAGGARSLYPAGWVFSTPDEAVDRLRALARAADGPGHRAAGAEAREHLHAMVGQVRSAWRALVLGELGVLGELWQNEAWDEAVARVRDLLGRPGGTVDAPTLRLANIVATHAGEPTLRLEVLRVWAAADPRPGVQHRLRMQQGQLRELTPGWRPSLVGAGPIAAPAPVQDRILHVLKSSRPHRTSGYTLRSAHLLTAQHELGMDVVAVTALDFPDGAADPSPALVEEVGGVRHHRLLREQVPEAEPVDRYLETFAARLLEVVQQERPSVLHVHSGHRGYELALAALAVGEATGIPVVYEVRGFFEALWTPRLELAESAEIYRLRRAVETEVMTAAAAVTTLSESMREDILARSEARPGAGPDPGRVFVVPNGVDPDAITPRPRRPDLVDRYGLAGRFTFGYVSNLDHPREGQELLARAVHHLLERGVDAMALVVGGGERAGIVRAEAQRWGVDDRVVLTGAVPYEEVADHYALLDVFVVPRIDERAARLVTPLKPYEAMAMELPVVVSELPALVEIIGAGERGRSFPVGDARALAAVLAGLAADQAGRERLAAAGRGWVERTRRWRTLAARTADVYDVARGG